MARALHAVDRVLLVALVERLARRMRFELSVTDGDLYVGINGTTLAGAVERFRLPAT